jgi:hypothetical protein
MHAPARVRPRIAPSACRRLMVGWTVAVTAISGGCGDRPTARARAADDVAFTGTPSAVRDSADVAATGATHGAGTRPAPGVVDSIVPIAEALRRFRADLGPAPGRLDGAPSRDALVRRFVRAVETSDTNALRAMTLSRAEFAYLYYPESPLSRPPYEEPPALLWFRVSEGSSTGIVRVLRRYGGRSLGYRSYACEPTPKREGANTLWERCRVRHVRAPGDTVEERLFGSVVARGGRFEFVSYANDF